MFNTKNLFENFRQEKISKVYEAVCEGHKSVLVFSIRQVHQA